MNWSTLKPSTTPMRRSALLAKKPAAAVKVRKRKCAICPIRFEQRSSTHVACSLPCAQEVAKRKREKAEKEDFARRKEAAKRRPDWIADAQKAFNAFIRARDAGLPCICCGKPMEPNKIGGSVDAGHYLSRGSASHLRFDERNCHAQRKNCNRPGGTTRAAFRAGMEARIGLEALEALESDQKSRDWTVADLKEIRDLYRKKLRDLKTCAA